MGWPKVIVERHGAVLVAELTDQGDDVRGVRAGLEQSLSELESSPDLVCGVLLVTRRSRLTGPGRRVRDQFDRVRAEWITDRRHRSKPVIAAAEGPVFNGGFHAVLACDLVVASADATFGFTGHDAEAVDDRVRMLSMGRMLPPNVIRELLLTDRTLDAERGERLGFVNRICPPGQARAAASAMALEIARHVASGQTPGLGPYRRQWLSMQANAFVERNQSGSV